MTTPIDDYQAAEPDEDLEVQTSGAERVVFFSDAVVAIAITLLALDLPVPAGTDSMTNGQLLHALGQHWPDYLAFLISFLVIGNHWATHRRVFRYVNKIDNQVSQLNMLWLFMVVLIPFASRLLAGDGGFGIRFTSYALIQVIASATLWLMARRLVGKNMLRASAPGSVRHVDNAPTIGIIGSFLVSIPVSFFTHWSFALWAASPWVTRAVRYMRANHAVRPLSPQGPDPAKARGTVGWIGGEVLEADAALVALPAQLPQERLEVEGAGAGRAAPRRVGDLHMGDAVAVLIQGLLQVLAHFREVVQVGEEGDAPRGNLLDDRGCLVAGVDRESGNVDGVDRLDEDGRVDLRGGVRGKSQVLDRDGILLRWVGAGEAVAVGRVEPRAAGAPRDLGDGVDVLPELAGPARVGQDAALPGGHIPAVDVEADELDPGITDGVHERVRVLVFRHVLVERPPELDRVEPGRLRRRGPLRQRQFREENRAVHVQPQPASTHQASLTRHSPDTSIHSRFNGTGQATRCSPAIRRVLRWRSPLPLSIGGMRLTRSRASVAAVAVALAAGVAAVPAAAHAQTLIQPEASSGIAGWTETGSSNQDVLTAGEGVTTVTQSGSTSVLYRGAASIPASLAVQGWTHIGDPDSADGYIIDAYQNSSSSATTKMYLLTIPSGSTYQYKHTLVSGELYNNSFDAISPDTQWMVSGDWGTQSRLYVYPTPYFNSRIGQTGGRCPWPGTST
jgi:uncharacterized membrane protein